ncbi:DnaB-like helicase N-terminal domain-containing protein [Streptomyces sp. LHD-70]|uniref:DnaB-like helicase N-terminal domain-containing protein n=1 Tax=Streptomyces sp. LHD-70 TaxID=3072140 RepID=UPI00280D517D|nr:DnaB-like helicase N-terminal domain-containing protein [Streptomyces sp. LHD-70]MDQ8704119.1 DnaB-like helicase N-terminal domain-containing protein [Streptomyces sp. LHD-70]
MNPLLSAEQAVLGSVLLDPDQLAHLDWLAPDHFYRPVHQALFAALRKLRSDGHPTVGIPNGPVPLSWVTDAIDEASLHVRGLTAVYAHTLIQACPRPEHAPVYGRMVLEGAIHRTVAQHAIRLHQAARADALRGEVEGALRSADVLTGVLTDLARRWGTEPRPVAPATSPATAPAASPPVRADQVAEDERFLLAVLTEQPRAMDEVVAWLRPGDFADPAHGQLYRCLGALHHRGEPIDRITLLWEAQRRGLLADGTLSGEQLTAICDGMVPGSAEWLGERVMRSSLTRTAAASARAVRALAEDEALGPGRLINHALHALGPLDEVRARWQSANGSPAPKPSTTPLASGPPPARVQAARARSTPHPAPSPPARTRPVPAPASARSPARGHP